MQIGEPKTSTLIAADKTAIFLRHWPIENPKAVLVVCHGLGEYGGRYGNLVNRVSPAGYAVFAHDHRGHGRSGGRRGHVDRFDRFLDDAYMVVQLARETYPDSKVFMLGHSMGGLISLAYALRHQDTLDGVIASGAALRLAVKVPVIKEFVGKHVASIWPTLSMGNELDPHHLTHDEEVVQAYIDDPLVHDRVTPRFFVEFTQAMQFTLNGAGALSSIPLLMFHGEADPIVAAEGTSEFFANAGSQDKKIEIFAGMYHEVLNEVDKDKALDLVQNWLDKHAGQ